jgi:hypothetical protein
MTETTVPKNTADKTPEVKTEAKRSSSTAKAKVKQTKKNKSEEKVEAKIKIVRDSFTMPQTDYAIIAELKQKALKAGEHIKKSELLRAGLHELSKLNSAQLKKTVSGLEKIKTGRPKKS